MSKASIVAVLLVAWAAAFAAQDAGTAKVIELTDGGTLAIAKDGTMIHTDAAGHRVKMKDGKVMEGKDGTRYMMKNGALWKTILEKGTLHPNH